ncbi:MAG: hydrogenase small subunit [Candidatus Marinimicrobia bacterium]|nr:hydrogenase small subunit [Candidatus Neomarinimicrobiota bacterium]MCF7828473.1 hydrogenase small subunit [Candidatus Neomarinimicrobiota bacterium]MCF7881963.1 hydrogenase small subunit [Candidatus Neomarinimicrobiota bacterium]
MARPNVSEVHDRISVHHTEELEARGVSRRQFIKFCTAMSAAMALPFTLADKVAAAVTDPARPPVIWLHFQDCTGCTESLLRATHPTVESLVLDIISLDYSETLLAAAGHQAEAAKQATIENYAGKFLLVVEGSIPTKDGGIYCKIGNKTAVSILEETLPKAAAAVAIGSCASWGGIPSSGPNPTGAKGVTEVMPDAKTPVINLPGCPPSPYNLTQTVVHYLTLKKLPELDKKGRPKFAYGQIIHENCERRAHFDAGRFAEQFGDSGHRQGWCLYKLGCKGPETHANCPSILYGDVGSGAWPVGTGHPCFGCTEEEVAFTKPLHQQASVAEIVPPAFYPRVAEERGNGLSIGAAALVGGAAGVAAGAGAMMAKELRKQDAEDEQAEQSDE